MSKSNWDLRHPRTLDEAFGDGTPRRFAKDRFTCDDWVGIISGVLYVVIVTLSWMGVV